MFDPNFIGIYDNAISSTECGTIIRWLETNDLWRRNGEIGLESITNRFDFTIRECGDDDWDIIT